MCLVTMAACSSSHSDPSLLSISTGRLQGQILNDDSNVMAFTGIPFAQPPIGDARWTSPKPAKHWTGIREAIDAPPACIMQITASSPESLRKLPQDENCLYLNVYTPVQALTQNNADSLPVLFMIHGGGRTRGSASRIRADIAALNRQGIVVVTPQYRLGIFSFFAHPELSRESSQNVSGNYGMQDLVLALEWVQANISYFGGDPASVTILGPSGGGTAVGVLLATPLSEGLFHRAAPLCSNAGISRMHFLKRDHLGLASAEELGQRFADSINAKSISDMRNISAKHLQQLVFESGVNQYDPPTGAADVIDGWMFPVSILELHKTGKRHDVPVLLGINEDEVSLFESAGLIDELPISSSAYEQSVNKRYGELSDRYLQQYPSENPVEAIYDAARDRVVSYGAQSLAQLSHNVSSSSFLYFMAHHPTDAEQIVKGSGQKRGVAHCTDDKYFFDWYPKQDAGEIDKKMQKTMSNYMVNFIKTGNPNHADLPDWMPYERSSKHYMRFENGEARPSQDMLPGMWILYENIKKRNERLGQSQHWLGGWASDDSLNKSRIKSD